VGDESALEGERTDADHALATRLGVEGGCREAGLGEKRVQPAGKPGRGDDADATRWVELVSQVVAKRHEIDEVVRVQVADDDRAQRARIESPGEPREPALAEVQADAMVAVGDDVCAGRGARAVRIGSAGPDDEELHCGRVPGPRAVGARQPHSGQGAGVTGLPGGVSGLPGGVGFGVAGSFGVASGLPGGDGFGVAGSFGGTPG